MKASRARPGGVEVNGLGAIPAPSTATAKVLLAPPKDAFLDAPTPKAPAPRVLTRQEKLLNDRRLAQKAKLDLQTRLEAAQLGSLLFTYGPPAHLSAQPATARSSHVTGGPPTHGVRTARPLTARLATQPAALDVSARRPATARPPAQNETWRPAGMHLLVASHDAEAHRPLVRSVWAKESGPYVSSVRDQSTNDTPRAMLSARKDLVPDDVFDEQEKGMLRCGVAFKCQPDPRWLELFKAKAIELKNAVELERQYAERMSTYSGKKISKARVQLNTPRDEPNRARVVL